MLASVERDMQMVSELISRCNELKKESSVKERRLKALSAEYDDLRAQKKEQEAARKKAAASRNPRFPFLCSHRFLKCIFFITFSVSFFVSFLEGFWEGSGRLLEPKIHQKSIKN